MSTNEVEMDVELERMMERKLELMTLGKVERPAQEPWLARGPEPVMTDWFQARNQRAPRVVGWGLDYVSVQREDGYTTFEARHMVERVWWTISETPPAEGLAQLEHWLTHRCWRTVLIVTGGYKAHKREWYEGQQILASYDKAARDGLRQAEEAQEALVLGRDEPCVVAADDLRVYVEPAGARYEVTCLAPEGVVSLGWATRRGHKLYEQLVRGQENSVFNADFGWVEPAQLEQKVDGKVALLCRPPVGQ